ncbi:hypothetical protein ONA91_10110 [Micromonospora sp. DR5-3]|uniref:hypothetical protein n=1 Tax=unclassified Micromonospora TaxID=2617518 RepID=UPI0011DBB0DF|nr:MULTISPECIES: hypothetical protein [unclassified Micromonospora]MCW3814808.1 hypothetical protein [Micromonospora sp. DR5-3]TYC24132.1 hypothetical protein FXF52_11610 [Micromonospora sp. MP36]
MRTDDEHVADRLRWLDDEPAGPPRIDLPGAIQEARRRRRNRRVAAAGAAALGVLAMAALPAALGGDGRAAPAPAASPSPSMPLPEPRPTGPWQGVCTATLLPVPGDPRAAVTGGDPDGRWLVGRRAPQGQGRMDFGLLIWEGDRVGEVELPGSMQELADVNRAGLAVGSSLGAGNEWRAWAVRNGEVIGLPVVTSGGATAVNDAGRIVGYRNLVPGKPWIQRPVVWDSYRSQPVDLPLPGPQWEGTAIDIDEDGTILAAMSDGHPDKPTRAVVWRPGAARPEVLPLPQVPGGRADRFLPLSLAGGWVTGLAERDTKVVPRSGAHMYPVRINLRTGQADVLKGALWSGTGNGQGWMAGWVSDDVPGVITDTRSVKLPVPDGWRGERQGGVTSFSDDGRVLGGKLESDDQVRPVRWTCR